MDGGFGMGKWKELAVDLLVDVAASMLIALGVYNFALYADFPVAGFTGIAIILYHMTGLAVGFGSLLLNIPVAIFCYRFLGREFFVKSVKSLIISSIFTDYVAPLLPIYHGDRLLAAICMGVLCGAGYAMIFMRGSSTGGQDFITMAIKKIRPHVTLGSITFVLDVVIIVIGTLLVFKDVDGMLYGIIVTYLMSYVINKMVYGTEVGKMTLIVTERGKEIANMIDETVGRGSTILQGTGNYSGEKKDIVLCACNNKQMYSIKKLARQIDHKAFTIIVESNEVVGEGFKEEIKDL